MQEGQLLMAQVDRDRLVTLRKTPKKRITQREAADELGLSIRLLNGMKRQGDKAVIHRPRGAPSHPRRMPCRITGISEGRNPPGSRASYATHATLRSR